VGGYYTPSAGDVIAAANWKTYVRDQTVNVFASAAARDSAITSPTEGMICYLQDSNLICTYDGAAWLIWPWAQYKRKSADQTVNNTATLANDSDLAWPVLANAVYELRMLILYNSGTVPDIKFAWTIPVGLAMTWVVTGFDTAGSFLFGNIDAEGSTRALGGTGANLAAEVSGIVNVGVNSGTLQLQWAQNTANASNTVVKAGSWGALTRYV
jgi:hypothetical protein